MRQKSIGGLDHELLENGCLLMPAKPRGKAIKAWKSLHKTLFLASVMCITSTYFISASVHFYEAVKGCLGRGSGSYSLAGLSDHPSKQENFMCQTFLNFETTTSIMLTFPFWINFSGDGEDVSYDGASSKIFGGFQKGPWSISLPRTYSIHWPSFHCSNGKFL